MSRLTFKNIKPGMLVMVDDCTACKSIFMGFSDTEITHGDGGVKFNTWKDLKASYGFKNFKDMDVYAEAEAESKGYGHGFHALFAFTDGGMWGAYRFNGKWVLGSSADPVRLEEIVNPSKY